MRWLVASLLLCVAGCGSSSKADAAKQDAAAAQEFVHKFYSNPDITFTITRVEGPEYAQVPKIPRDHIAKGYPDQAAACCVRVWFDSQNGRSTTHDSWLVWVGSDHKAVGWSFIPGSGEWRAYVRSLARK